jgi:hypothetical protein
LIDLQGGHGHSPSLSRLEAGIAVVCAFLFAGWTLLWDRLGLWQGGPLPYGNFASCDPWHYFGLSLFPQGGLVLGPESRFVARPAYFGVVFALKSLLPTVGVSVISYVAFLGAILSALFLALRALFSRRTAALTCTLIGFSPLLLNESSTTYVTVASLAYGCGMLGALLWAARVRDGRPALADGLNGLAGFLFLWSANANLLAVKFNFLFCLFALLGQLSPPLGLWRMLRAGVRPGAFFLAGMGLGVLGLVLLSMALGLGARVLLNQVQAALEGMGDYHYPNWQWETVAFGLILLAAILCAIAVGRARGTERGRGDLLLLVGVVIATCLFNLHAVFAIGDQNLVYDWFYFLLLPLVALAFGAAFDPLLAGLSRREVALVFVALLAAILAFNWLVASSFEIKGWLYNNTQLALCIALGILLCVLALGRLRSFAATLAAVLAVALPLQAATGSQMRNHFFTQRTAEKAYTDMTEKALQYLSAYLDENPVVWLSRADNWHLDLPIMRGLLRCSTYKATFPDELPEPEVNQPPLEAGRRLLVVDGQRRDPAAIDAALRPHGYRLDSPVTHFIPLDGAQGVQLTIGRVARISVER